MMLEASYIQESLANLVCYKCGRPLEGAKLMPSQGNRISLVCASCQAQSLITLTPNGVGAVPMVSDLSEEEIQKFSGASQITYAEILNLHEKLKSKSIWNLLQKKEKSLAKRQKH